MVNEHVERCSISLVIACVPAQSCLTLCYLMNPMDPMDPASLLVHGIFLARILEWVALSFSGDLPNPGIKPHLLYWQGDSLPLSHLGIPAIGN